jgi:transcriptional regulator with XRE-family HTH domain
MNLDIGEKLLILRKRKGASQKEVAEAIGTSVMSVVHYENGKYKPSLDVIKKISSYFDVTIDELLNSTSA